MEPFSRQFTVVAVDLAGHGESGLGRKAWTIAAFGEDVAAVVDKLGLKRVVLIGHSMGGDVVVAAARRLPGRVAGLVWVDTYKKLGTPRTPEQVEDFMAPFRADFVGQTRTFVRGLFHAGADKSLVERVAAYVAQGADVALAAMRSAITYDREVPPALQELKLPVVAINPDSPPTDTASLDRYGVKAVFLPGVGHFLPMEDPPRFNALLKAELDKPDLGGRSSADMGGEPDLRDRPVRIRPQLPGFGGHDSTPEFTG